MSREGGREGGREARAFVGRFRLLAIRCVRPRRLSSIVKGREEGREGGRTDQSNIFVA